MCCQTLGVQHRIDGSFPPPPSQYALINSSLLSGMKPSQASAPRWETGGQGVPELDGAQGVLPHALDRGQSLVFTFFVPLGSCSMVRVCLETLFGLCTFAAGFCRPLFPIFQEVCSEVLDRNPKDAFAPRSASVVELFIAVLFAGVDLRTPLRRTISCSDASHAGAGPSEASVCSRHCPAGASIS